MTNQQPITAAELQEILRLHALWLRDDDSGRRADLREANLYEADLYEADLRGANLRGADLRHVDLREANLYGADLSEANLSEANLSRANLYGADLRRADLREANLILIGQDIRGYLFYAWHDEDNVVVIRAGCRTFTGITAARDHWTARHTQDAVLHADCLSLVDRCETLAKARGWLPEPGAVAVAGIAEE